MYSKMKELYDKTRLDMFAMAVSYIIDTGYSVVEQITDEEIAEMEGNGLMTKEFVQGLVKLAREITRVTEHGTEVIQFCAALSVFETTYYTEGEHLNHNTLEEGIGKLLSYIMYDEEVIMPTSSEEETKEQLADLLDIEVDDIDKLLERG